MWHYFMNLYFLEFQKVRVYFKGENQNLYFNHNFGIVFKTVPNIE
jgi:hypothetical protein